MKSGRLIKFQRPGGLVQAYLYRDEGSYHAVLYVLSPAGDGEPVHRLSSDSDAKLEEAVRAWVDGRFPRKR